MKRAICFLSVLLALPALADYLVATDGRNTVRLSQAACPKSILAVMKPDLRAKVKAAQSTVNGKEQRGCWTLLEPGFVSVLFEDGAEAMIPMEEFKRVPGA